MLYKDWKTFFAARADNEQGNKNTAVYTEAWSPETNDEARFQTLISGPDNVLLATNNDNKIHALHSFKVMGGSFLRPNSTKLMCLLGTGANATALIVDKQSLLIRNNLITPTIDELEECFDEDDVNAVPMPTEPGEVTYPGSASFLPAPWLVDVIMGANTSDPTTLIPMVNSAAIEYDEIHENDRSYVTNASNQADYYILWAWGIKENRVTSAKLTIDPNDPDVERFYLDRHRSCISQTQWNNIPDGLPPPPPGAEMNGFLAPLLATVSRTP